MLAVRPYADLISGVLKQIAAGAAEGDSPSPLDAKAPRPNFERGTLRLVVFTADKGLCGSFNVNVLRRATQIIRENQGKRKIELVAVGRKGRDFFRHFNASTVGQFVQLGIVQYPVAEAITREQVEAYLSGLGGRSDPALHPLQERHLAQAHRRAPAAL